MRATLAAFCLLLVAGCLEGDPDDGATQPTQQASPSAPGAGTTVPAPVTPTPTATGPHAVEFRRIDAGQQSGIQEKKDGAITTDSEWSQFWGEHSSEPRPSVDFTRETVAYVFAGERGNSCWAERVAEVMDDGAGSTTVKHTLYSPPPNAFCADVITYPYDIVAIQGAGRTVGFSQQTGTYPPQG